MSRNGAVDHSEEHSDEAIPGGTLLRRCAPRNDTKPLSWRELARASTARGDELLLRERMGTFEIRCNGWDLMSNRAHYSEQWMARIACQRLRTAARRVLIGGLGMGFTLRAALDVLPVAAQVVVAELLPDIIAWNHGVLAPLTNHPLGDPRVRVECADVAELLQPDSFDAILLDVDNGPGAVMLCGNTSLYSPEGVQRMHRALRREGILAVWSASPSPPFEQSLSDAGLCWDRTDVPARGTDDDPLHSIYLATRTIARSGARTQTRPSL
jgi:spermidine synthase